MLKTSLQHPPDKTVKKKTLRYRRDWVLLYLFKFIRVIIRAWIHSYPGILKR